MTSTEFLKKLSSLIKDVLTGSSKYVDLQKFVDDAIIEDGLPSDLPADLTQHIFDLQTDLELIAEHQFTYAGTSSMLRQKDIIKKIQKYEAKIRLR